jgi:hypothetical protein
VDAQPANLVALGVSVVGLDGGERLRLTQGPGAAEGIDVLDPDGVRIIRLGSVSQPNANLELYAGDGTRVIRLGTGSGPQGDQPVQTALSLADLQGKERARINIAEDGTPSIRLLDADGNVTWSAP